MSTLRRKKRDYDKKVKENGGNDIDEEDNDEEEDNSETPKKRGRRLHLTRERIDRLTAIDFEWTLQTHTISWEERMENLSKLS